MFGTNFVILCKLLKVLNVVYMESKEGQMWTLEIKEVVLLIAI